MFFPSLENSQKRKLKKIVHWCTLSVNFNLKNIFYVIKAQMN